MRKQIIFLVLSMLFVLGLIGCTGDKISEIVEDAEFFKGEEVTVRGEVRDVFISPRSFEFESAFEVKDETGSIWVYRVGRRAPEKGRLVAVSGTVDTDFTLANRKFKVIVRETTGTQPSE